MTFHLRVLCLQLQLDEVDENSLKVRAELSGARHWCTVAVREV